MVVHLYEKKVRGIIFDLDGTLIDSIGAYFEVFKKAAAQVDVTVRREDVLGPAIVEGPMMWQRAFPLHIADREEKIQRCFTLIPKYFKNAIEDVHPFSGVDKLLQALKKNKIKIGLVTSSWAASLRPIQKYSLSHYFDVIITREDGYPLKPSPVPILECLNRMNVDPDLAATVGDSPLDIRAGKGAGTLTFGVLTGIGSRQQLEAESPTDVLEKVTEILEAIGFKAVD